MRLRWVVGLVLASCVGAQHSNAETAYQDALAQLRELVDTSIDPVVTSSTPWLGALVERAAHLAERVGMDGVGRRMRVDAQQWSLRHRAKATEPAGLSERVAAWLDQSPTRGAPREPHTFYDVPDHALWPDWDFDAVKAGRAQARKQHMAVLNGWEQAMWGPFVADLFDAPNEAVQRVIDAHDAAERYAMLSSWIANVSKSYVPETLLTALERKKDTKKATEAKHKRARAIAQLEWAAFEGEMSPESVIDATFDAANATGRPLNVHADALWVLGEHSLWGTHGAQPNISRAIRAFERLADTGNATAHARLGFLYNSPLLTTLYGIEPQPERSHVHYTLGAQEGERAAQLAVGYRYDRGLGVPPDCMEALAWYDAAAQQAYKTYLEGPIGGRRLPYAKLRLSDRAALKRGLQRGLASGMDNLLLLAKLYRPAVRRLVSQEPLALQDTHTLGGLLDAYEHQGGAFQTARLSFLAHALYRGSVVGEAEAIGAVSRDFRRAHRFALIVAEQRWPAPVALENFAWPSTRPDGTLQAAYRAAEVEESVRVHAANSAALLGQMYLRGDGVAQDFVKAKVWLTRAALDGNTRGAHALGRMFEHGWGGTPDLERASKIYESAKAKESAPDVALEMAKAYMHAQQPDKALTQLAIAGSVSDLKDARESTLLETGFEVQYLAGAIRADWAYHQNQSATNCAAGLPGLKRAAERGDWDDPIFHRAEAAHVRRDVATSLMAWAVAGASGIEEAQDNIAYVLDPVRSYLRPAPEQPTDRTALAFWANSALQGSPHAMIKLCDYLRLARGTNATAHRAAQCYLALVDGDASLVVPRWHLAQMYESGDGVLQPDYPLAKRYYDMVAALAPTDAVLTAFPALIRLHVKAFWRLLKGDDTARRLLHAYIGGKKEAQPPAKAKAKAKTPSLPDDVWLDWAVDLAVFSMGIVCLVVLMYVRRVVQRRRDAANVQLAQMQALR